MKEQFEIRLNFKSNTGGPERVFLAMAEYVSAFDNLVHVVSRGINPESAVACELSAVEISSLKSIVDCIGGYCSTLSRVPSMIANQMVDIDEIDKEEQVEEVAIKLEADILADTNVDFPNQVNINRFELAKGLNQLAEASNKLMGDETVDVRKKGGNVYSTW